jgi:putative DNA primase/helicase
MVLGTESIDKAAAGWAAHAEALAEWAMRRKVNRVDAWGGYNRVEDREKVCARKDGTTYKLGATLTRPAKHRRGRAVLTTAILARHFRARGPLDIVGVHTTSPQNTCKWGNVEIDWHSPDSPSPEVNWRAAKGWHDRLRQRGFHPLLTDSNGAGGYHLDVLLRDPIPSARMFYFFRELVADHALYGLPNRPETFPKQPQLRPRQDGRPSYGNWVRLPGLHHTRPHWSRVWGGDQWLEGAEAAAFILGLDGDPVELIPDDSEIRVRVRAYMAKLPHLNEGQGRDDVAYNFLCFLARDMGLSDAEALNWAEEWDQGNHPPKGRERLQEILRGAHDYGQRAYGSGRNGDGVLRRNGHCHPGRPPAAPDVHDEPGEPTPPGAAAAEQQHPKEEVNEAQDDPHRLARLYLDDHTTEEGPALCWWQEEYFRWDGRAYRNVGEKELRAQVNARVKGEFDECNLRAIRAWDDAGGCDENGKAIPKPVARKVSGRLVVDVAGALQGLTVLPSEVEAPAWQGPAPFPADEMLACNNTLVHLPSWANSKPHLHPLTPRFFSTNALDYDFLTDWKPPETWLDFMARLWPQDDDAISTLQEWFGYCLLPDTRQHKILMIVGPPRSGKGTIARVLRALIGLQNTAGPTLASLGTNFGLQPLLGKTLAIISDARLSGRTDAAVVVERLLSISGEDAQTIDRKYMTPVTKKLSTRFMVLTNELPKLNDPSGALVGRMLVLRQTQNWYGREDTTLTARLLVELPGILLWAMEGWKRLHNRGHFAQPDSGRKLVNELNDLSSPIGAFLRDCCQVGAGLEVPVQDLFARWRRWCDHKGRKEAGTEQTFGRDLRAKVPWIDDRQHRAGGVKIRLYVGIRLLPDEDQDEEIHTPF